MIKTSKTYTADLSASAVKVLENTRGFLIGTQTGAIGPIMRELFDAGIIGVNGGLTAVGSAIAERVQSAQLDALFGPE